MKRSLFITLEFPPQAGGVAAYYYNVCKHFAPGSMVVVAPPATRADEFDRRCGFPVIREPLLARFAGSRKKIPFLSLLYGARWKQKLRHLIATHDIEYIHVGNVLPLGTTVLFYAKKHHIPYLVYTHGLDILLPQQFIRKKILLKKILKAAHSVISNSQFTARQLTQLGVPSAKITVVNPCPSLNQLQTTETRLTQLTERYRLGGKKILLTVGRLVDRKGVDLVIQALPMVIKHHPDVLYLVVGGGPAESRLRKLVHQNRLGEYVQFIGHASVADLPAYYQLCDVFVMPARQIGPDVEGFGIVYLEANSFGKPVIGGDSGGVPEAVINEQTGLLVNPTSAHQLAQAINRLLDDQTLAEKLGVQGMERVIKQFDWGAQTEKIKALLH